MALEYRNGRSYYYRKVRKGNKIESAYMGSGVAATIIAELDKYKQELKKDKQEEIRDEKDLHRKADLELINMENTLNILFTCVAIANGYHKPKRKWRKKRQKK